MNTAEKIVYTTSLEQLLSGLVTLPAGLPPECDVRVSGVTLDSRTVAPGDLFFACFGRNHDGRDFVDAAIDKGAAAILAQADARWQGVSLRRGVPVLCVDDLAARVSAIAGRFFDEPSAAMTMIGVTGTNGKTSCTQFIAQVLGGMGRSCGVIGTLGNGFLPALEESTHTTPDPVFLQAALADLRSRGADSVAMEVSSQGLHQHRVSGVRFDVAVFTNLTRDHLDYHGSMEDYAETKRRLFMMAGLSSAVVNMDDPYACRILNTLSPSVRSYTFSVANSHADIHALSLQLTPRGYRARVRTPFGEGEIAGSLLGRFNFSNVLAVLATLIATESVRPHFSLSALLERIAQLQPVSGRMQIVAQPADITAVVDYAHTPDALQVSLQALREHFHGRIWCVFGCGGNRDQGKRPLMAEIAERHADMLVVTDDNPRLEDADAIVRQIVLGVTDTGKLIVERDRARAIALAVARAAPGDVVMIAGKGHETYQDIKGQKLMFSDVAQARAALQLRSAAGVAR
jgi:UDP-N-acetylmuramoyl-L-alanyl-D-glutamate--2,6-diaminopimelate ligase